MDQLPKWSNEEAVTDWVNNKIKSMEYEDAIEEPQFEFPDVSFSEARANYWNTEEPRAIAAAEDGNMKPMADLIDPCNPLLWMWPQPENWRYSSKTLALIAGYLRGERSTRGAPKKPIEQRQAATLVHGAAEEFALIERILDDAYPKERGRRARAISIAAKRANAQEMDFAKDSTRVPRKINNRTLECYLRSKKRIR
jgi:hypothetical protein